MGFNSGTCHANTIVDRGQLSYLGVGTYALYFTDGTAGIDCSAPVDSAQECFLGGACATSAGLSPASITESNYTPHIVKSNWYDLIVTFNDTVYKMYVNDSLVNTTTITTPGVHMGTSTDGLSIGYDTYDSIGGYPYPFNGIIDDVKIFNRPLDSTEVHGYATAVASVTKEDNISSILTLHTMS